MPDLGFLYASMICSFQINSRIVKLFATSWLSIDPVNAKVHTASDATSWTTSGTQHTATPSITSFPLSGSFWTGSDGMRSSITVYLTVVIFVTLFRNRLFQSYALVGESKRQTNSLSSLIFLEPLRSKMCVVLQFLPE